MKQHEAGWRCPLCRRCRVADYGPDPCLSAFGLLPGVKFACCGHGDPVNGRAYIVWENGVTIYFDTVYEVRHMGKKITS